MIAGTRLRVMPKHRLSLALLFAVAASPAAADPIGLNGHGLKDLCANLSQTGYFAGAVDQSIWDRSARYCPPADMQAWQARDAVCNFVSAVPADKLMNPAPWHIREALQSAYPCASDPGLAEAQELPLRDMQP